MEPNKNEIWKRSTACHLENNDFAKSKHRNIPEYSELEGESNNNKSIETFGISISRKTNKTNQMRSLYTEEEKSSSSSASSNKTTHSSSLYNSEWNPRKQPLNTCHQVPRNQRKTIENIDSKQERKVTIVANDITHKENSHTKLVDTNTNLKFEVEINGDRRQFISQERDEEMIENHLPRNRYNDHISRYQNLETKTLRRFEPYNKDRRQILRGKGSRCKILGNKKCQRAIGEAAFHQLGKPVVFKASGNTQKWGDNIVRKIVPFLVSGKKTLDALMREMSRNTDLKVDVDDPKELLLFLENHNRNFCIEKEKENNNQILISLTTDIEFCKDFISLNNSKVCSKACGALHICMYHILGKCDADMDSCQYGHNLSTPHNNAVFSAHFLNELSFGEIQSLMQKPQNRRGIAIPKVCSHYNVQHGCRNPDICKYLHLCSYMFHENGCKFSSRCKRSHTLNDRHNKNILELYGLDKTDQDETRRMIKAAMENKGVYQNSKSKIDSFKRNHRNAQLIVPPLKQSGAIDTASSGNINWSCVDKSTNAPIPMNFMEMKELEKLYQNYQIARFRQVSINGERYSVDMQNLSAENDKSNAGGPFILKRNPDFIIL